MTLVRLVIEHIRGISGQRVTSDSDTVGIEFTSVLAFVKTTSHKPQARATVELNCCRISGAMIGQSLVMLEPKVCSGRAHSRKGHWVGIRNVARGFEIGKDRRYAFGSYTSEPHPWRSKKSSTMCQRRVTSSIACGERGSFVRKADMRVPGA